MSPVQIDTSAIAPTGLTTPREPPERSPFAATATATTDTNSSAGHSERHVQVTRRRGQAAPTPIHSLGVTGAADTTLLLQRQAGGITLHAAPRRDADRIVHSTSSCNARPVHRSPGGNVLH
jgi:hypothetical protein